MLIVFSGLPGTGKTTISRVVARRNGATWLRIDTIEQAIRACGMRDVGASGYAVAQHVAVDNLAQGRTVVADCVNPGPASRQGWRAAAERAGARLLNIEIVCSDPVEHRRRVETRVAEIPGHALPGWDDVMTVDYVPWPDAPPVIDTARLSTEGAIAMVEAAMTGLRSLSTSSLP